jgi:hypothetical protein
MLCDGAGRRQFGSWYAGGTCDYLQTTNLQFDAVREHCLPVDEMFDVLNERTLLNPARDKVLVGGGILLVAHQADRPLVPCQYSVLGIEVVLALGTGGLVGGHANCCRLLVVLLRSSRGRHGQTAQHTFQVLSLCIGSFALIFN